MQTLKIFIIVAVLSIAVNMAAQQTEEVDYKPSWLIGIETGFNTNDVVKKIPSQIRMMDINRYHIWYHRNSRFKDDINSIYYFGVKPEIQLTERFSITSGIRVAFFKDLLESTKQYFLWELPGNTNNMNYVAIKKVYQTVYNIGIPLEFRFYPKKRDGIVRHYFVLGTLINFSAFTSTKIEFASQEMSKYNADIKRQLDKPVSFFTYGYAGIGLKIGKMNKPFWVIEAYFPMLELIGADRMVSSYSEGGAPFKFGLNTSIKIPVNL